MIAQIAPSRNLPSILRINPSKYLADIASIPCSVSVVCGVGHRQLGPFVRGLGSASHRVSHVQVRAIATARLGMPPPGGGMHKASR